VVAEDDWTMAVTTVPVRQPTTRFDDTALKMALIRFPAVIWRPSVIIFMPRMNMPESAKRRNEHLCHRLPPSMVS
jgi:hypothetical protein